MKQIDSRHQIFIIIVIIPNAVCIKEWLTYKKYLNSIILETKIDLDCCTKFKINITLYEDELSDPDKMKAAMAKTHVLDEICSYVKQWVRQITMVLIYVLYY